MSNNIHEVSSPLLRIYCGQVQREIESTECRKYCGSNKWSCILKNRMHMVLEKETSREIGKSA